MVINIKGYKVLIDNEDFEKVNKYKWHAQISRKKLIYFCTNIYEKDTNKMSVLLLHRVILNTPNGLLTDHKDGNTLNNQKSNLRTCTFGESSRNRGKRKDNRSGFKGVSFYKKDKKWVARIMINKISKYLGSFTSPQEAYKAYCVAAIKYHGEYARFK